MFTLYNSLVYKSIRQLFYNLINTYLMKGLVCLMVKLNAINLLEKNGKTKYWLYKQLGMSYQNFSKMINNETKSIRYEVIDIMCDLFSCTPNELFIREIDENESR